VIRNGETEFRGTGESSPLSGESIVAADEKEDSEWIDGVKASEAEFNRLH